ncbi:MAG TPA: tetratricopeptide repeat protein [Rhizomicrobium sp.]|nr:tetratricopeptide repeat protein [Rhizomicrobium sp.]
MDFYARGLKLSLAGRHAEAITEFERALAASPDDVRVLFALGNTARSLGLARPAAEFYRRVLALAPERLEATVNLANLMRSHAQPEAAEALLSPALARNPDAPELWLALGSAWRDMGDGGRALFHYREALARRPADAAALTNVADILAESGAHDEALAHYARALRLEPDNPQIRMNRATLLLARGELKQGWKDYAARTKIPGKVPVPHHNLPRWTGAALKRTRLLVTAEQGVGDEVMFASLVGELAARARDEGGSVLLECEPRLVSLFARSFPDVAVHPSAFETRGGVVHARCDWLRSAGGANAAVEAGSLPRYLRPTPESFPRPNVYLRPDPDERERRRAAFAPLARPLIGICWRSGKTTDGRAVEYAPLDAWAAFARELPGSVVSVQYGAQEHEIAALRDVRDIVVPGGIDQKNELDRVAAMLSVLDVVVTAPTAVAWLAAGSGVPTCRIMRQISWTGFGCEFEPFAPAARSFVPRRAGDWADALAQAGALISALHA